jgi:hypothetical protein
MMSKRYWAAFGVVQLSGLLLLHLGAFVLGARYALGFSLSKVAVLFLLPGVVVAAYGAFGLAAPRGWAVDVVALLVNGVAWGLAAVLVRSARGIWRRLGHRGGSGVL